MFNENIISGKWKQIKGELQRKWGNLTGDEIDKMKGNVNSISGLVQERYGLAQEEARKQVNDLISNVIDLEDKNRQTEPPQSKW
ncbi:MAG: CsbD family protein [Pseudobdellovibrionaceae bacterium]